MGGVNIGDVQRRLPTRRIEWFESVPSTMSIAAELPHGTVVIAEEQTAGIGRHGHEWHSEAGAGLYCSIVLGPAQVSSVITLALGLATVEAIARVTDFRCDLRWPNDVMANDRKVAGILVQMTGNAPVAGIGINVNHLIFPLELAQVATSLRLTIGRKVSREALLCELVPAVDSFYRMMLTAGSGAIIETF